MNSVELLYDHYKETFRLSKEAQTRRNKSFILLCLLEALSFLVLISPEKAFELLLSEICSRLNTTLTLGNAILQTLLWLLSIYTLIRYIQDVLYVERQYEYLGRLEKEIAGMMEISIFERESENYNRNYPQVLNLIDLFYKMFMPLLLVFINTIHIYGEWKIAKSNIALSLLCDTVFYIVTFILIWFYFFEIHSKLTEFFKKHVPFIDKIAKTLRQILRNA